MNLALKKFVYYENSTASSTILVNRKDRINQKLAVGVQQRGWSRVNTIASLWYGTVALDTKNSGGCRPRLFSIFRFPPNTALTLEEHH